MLTVVAPASIAAVTTSARKESSVREASSGENSTSSQSSRAIDMAPTALLMISSFAILSLCSRWILLVATKTWIRCRSAPLTAACTFSISPALHRARPQITGPRFASAIALTDSKSPGEAAGKPASMMSTFNSDRAFATLSFSLSVMLQPGACSPSRSVVSNMRICLSEALSVICCCLRSQSTQCRPGFILPASPYGCASPHLLFRWDARDRRSFSA